MASILDLTNDEVSRIITDLFHPKKITCIKKYKREQSISCKVYTRWFSEDENGKEDSVICCDEVILTNPFTDAGLDAGEIPLRSDDFVKYKQFCFAHGKIGRAHV